MSEIRCSALSAQRIAAVRTLSIGPTLLEHGTPDQQHRYLHRILTAEDLGLSQHVLNLCSLKKGLVLVTGDTSSAIKKLPQDELLRVASKPVDADELLTLIRELLDDSVELKAAAGQ